VNAAAQKKPKRKKTEAMEAKAVVQRATLILKAAVAHCLFPH
jgi:hypothetical protein